MNIYLFKLEKGHREVFGDDRPHGYYFMIMKLFDFWAMHPLRPELATIYQTRNAEDQCLFKEKYIEEVPLVEGMGGVAPAWHFQRGIHRSWRLIEYLERDGEIKVPCSVWLGLDGYPDGYVHEGHHRSGAARVLGWKTIPALKLIVSSVVSGVCYMTDEERREMRAEQLKRGLLDTSRIHGLKIAHWTQEELKKFMYPRPHDPKKYYMKGMTLEKMAS